VTQDTNCCWTREIHHRQRHTGVSCRRSTMGELGRVGTRRLRWSMLTISVGAIVFGAACGNSSSPSGTNSSTGGRCTTCAGTGGVAGLAVSGANSSGGAGAGGQVVVAPAGQGGVVESGGRGGGAGSGAGGLPSSAGGGVGGSGDSLAQGGEAPTVEAGNGGESGDGERPYVGAEGAAGGCGANVLHPWAEWPMPNPASAGLPNPQSFSAHGEADEEIVTDDVTGLEWQRNGDFNDFVDQQAAIARCEALTLGGFCDWRLPSRIELVSLLDVSHFDPAIDPDAFPTPQLGLFWTSSTYDSTDGWAVNFSVGAVFFEGASSSALSVRCVRTGRTSQGAAVPSPRYEPAGDGELRDLATGLIWQIGQSPTELVFDAAADYCATLAPSDWRVPSVTELQTLVDESRSMPAIDTAAYPETESASYWSSSLYAGFPGNGWMVSFANGSSSYWYLYDTHWVRCVR